LGGEAIRHGDDGTEGGEPFTGVIWFVKHLKGGARRGFGRGKCRQMGERLPVTGEKGTFGDPNHPIHFTGPMGGGVKQGSLANHKKNKKVSIGEHRRKSRPSLRGRSVGGGGQGLARGKKKTIVVRDRQKGRQGVCLG